MIIVAYGANIDGPFGTPAETFEHAVCALNAAGVRVVQASSLWKTAPVGVTDVQPWYVNAVLVIDTDLSARALLDRLLSIETQMGRIRDDLNAARSIDLDLICYHNDVICEGDDLVVPHPRMHERGFVLYPLKEVNPGWRHPESGVSLDALIGDLPEEQEAVRL